MIHLWRLLLLAAGVFFIIAAVKAPGDWTALFWYYLGFGAASVGLAAYGWPPPPPPRA